MRKLENVPKWLADDKEDGYGKLNQLYNYLEAKLKGGSLGTFNELVQEVNTNIEPLTNLKEGTLKNFMGKDLRLKLPAKDTAEMEAPATNGQKLKAGVLSEYPFEGIGFASLFYGIPAAVYSLISLGDGIYKAAKAEKNKRWKGFKDGLKEPTVWLKEKCKCEEIYNTRIGNYENDNYANAVKKIHGYRESLVSKYDKEQEWAAERKRIAEICDKALTPKPKKEEEKIEAIIQGPTGVLMKLVLEEVDGKEVLVQKPLYSGPLDKFSNVQKFMDSMEKELEEYSPEVNLETQYHGNGIGEQDAAGAWSNFDSKFFNANYKKWAGVNLPESDPMRALLGMTLSEDGCNIVAANKSPLEQCLDLVKGADYDGNHKENVKVLFEKLAPLAEDAALYVAQKSGDLDKLYDHLVLLGTGLTGPAKDKMPNYAMSIHTIRQKAAEAYALLIEKDGVTIEKDRVTPQSLAKELGIKIEGDAEQICGSMMNKLVSWRKKLGDMDLSHADYNENLDAEIQDIFAYQSSFEMDNTAMNTIKDTIKKIGKIYGAAADIAATVVACNSVLSGREYAFKPA